MVRRSRWRPLTSRTVLAASDLDWSEIDPRTFALSAPLTLSWRQLLYQFGADPTKATKPGSVSRFRGEVLRELKKIKNAWPGLNYHTVTGGLVVSPSTPRIAPTQSQH